MTTALHPSPSVVIPKPSVRPAGEKGEPRLLELDGVRGIAVIMVLVFHVFAWTMESSPQYSRSDWSGPAAVVLKVTKPGWLGVDLFFVLSGYLITGILLRNREKHRYFRNFYGRRVLRIFPIYFLTLLAILIVYSGSGSFVLLSALFMANITAMFGVPSVYGPLWSLAVEEHFYLLWPWIVRRIGKRGLLGLALAICVIEPVLRAVGFCYGLDVYFPSWFRFDGLAWGASIALIMSMFSPAARTVRMLAYAFIVAGVTLWIGGSPLGIMTRKTVLGAALQITPPQWVFVGLVGLAIVSGGTVLGKVLGNPVFTVFGKWSYCIYLNHWMCMTLWDRSASAMGFHPETSIGPFGAICLRAGAVIAASVAIAALTFRFIEGPILSLKKHFA